MAPKSDRELFEEGIELFNARRFFECHEVWEELWKRSDGDAKLLYQGLIQSAVAILHYQRNNRDGAASLHAKASEKLIRFPDCCMGIKIGDFRRALDEFFARALNAPGGGIATIPPKLNRV